MTKVSILGEESKEKKKIEFLGCLMDDCDGTNYNSFSDGFLTPSRYEEIILITQKYNKDIMLARRRDGEEHIMFGHFNDGVV